MMLPAEMVAGAPFFFSFSEGDGDGVGVGVSLACGVALGVIEGEADSLGEGVGIGEVLRFFFLRETAGEDSGDGLGENFFLLADEDGVSDGVGLATIFFLGGGDFSGDALCFGEGDFSAVDFFFVCFRGAGVGVGANSFLSLLPNDSSAGARMAKFVAITRPARTPNPRANARRLAVIPSAVEEPRGASSDVPRGPSTALRSARDDTRRKLFLRELGQHRFVQPNTALQILEREILIRRMGAAIGQREAHQQRLHPKNTAEL